MALFHFENCKDIDLDGNTFVTREAAIFAKNVERLRAAGNVATQGDPVALVRALLNLGLVETDVAELGQAVDADVEAGVGAYPRVRVWVESAAKKAAAGALKVSGDVAASVISQLLLKGLGISL